MKKVLDTRVRLAKEVEAFKLQKEKAMAIASGQHNAKQEENVIEEDPDIIF
jgi:hypothetical protein